MLRFLSFSSNLNRITFVMVLVLAMSDLCEAQLNANLLKEFELHDRNSFLTNPAAIDTSYDLKLLATGINELRVSNVARYYFDADKILKSKDRNELHHLGVQVTNSRLGEYINKNRFYLRYSWFSQLTKQSSLSAGVQFGVVNFSFLTSQGGAGGSDMAPDGAVGLQYITTNFVLGASVQQMFVSEIMPVEQVFVLERIYSVNALKTIEINAVLDLRILGVIQLFDDDVAYRLGITSEIYDHFLIGINNYDFQKTAFTLGVDDLFLKSNNISIFGTFSVYHTSEVIPTNAVELMLSYEW